MWTALTQDDLRRAQDELKQRRLEMEARHAEELRALDARHSEERTELDAKLTKIEETERAIEAFVGEFLHTDKVGEPEPLVLREEAQTSSPQHLKTPTEVEVIATNWGNAKFAPAPEPEPIGKSTGKDWGS